MINQIHNEDCRTTIARMREAGIQPNCVVTSPPYYNLRDYGHPDQIGLENTPEEYIQKLVQIFGAIGEILSDDGTLWVNIADTYTGYKANTGDTEYAGYPGAGNRLLWPQGHPDER